MPAPDLETIVALAKRRGFVYSGSDIYGGLANSWDYGPLGVELKNNIQQWWWERFVQQREDMVGIDAAILMNPKVWQASGHVASFNDAMVDCKQCKARFRADHLIEDAYPDENVEGKSPKDLSAIIADKDIACPKCGAEDFTDARTFNLLFTTNIGSVEGEGSKTYLRGEIAQAMFVNFKNVLDTTRVKLPFGIASVGRAFRNEITPGNFIFRTLEFDLMEFEYFIRESDWEKQFDYWLQEQQTWLSEMGFNVKHIRVREHTKDELSHYSRKTVDIEYKTPFGWRELFGLAYRTDFDLKSHMEHSGVDLRYTDPESKEQFIPHVIEPTFGLTRLLLMTMLEAYHEEPIDPSQGKGEGKERRVVLKLHPRLAPYKAAVFPLVKNKPELVEKARGVFGDLLGAFPTVWDERGNIGKRYFSQDEIGTPFCITIDYDTLEDDTVTVRERDTTQQERVAVSELVAYLTERLQ